MQPHQLLRQQWSLVSSPALRHGASAHQRSAPDQHQLHQLLAQREDLAQQLLLVMTSTALAHRQRPEGPERPGR